MLLGCRVIGIHDKVGRVFAQVCLDVKRKNISKGFSGNLFRIVSDDIDIGLAFQLLIVRRRRFSKSVPASSEKKKKSA